MPENKSASTGKPMPAPSTMASAAPAAPSQPADACTTAGEASAPVADENDEHAALRHALADETLLVCVASFEGNKLKPHEVATAHLLCDTDQEQDAIRRQCTSSLSLLDDNDEVVAEAYSVDGLYFEQVAGNHGKLSLTNFELGDEGELLVVEQSMGEGDMWYKQRTTNSLYALKEKTLVRVLELEVVKSDDPGPDSRKPSVKEETTYAPGKKLTNGVHNIIATTTTTSRSSSGRERKSTTVTTYKWNGTKFVERSQL
jgi:hypothetical protein